MRIRQLSLQIIFFFEVPQWLGMLSRAYVVMLFLVECTLDREPSTDSYVIL